MKRSLGISNFLEEIASLSHSIVLLYFFALFTWEGFLISPCYSPELYIEMGVSFYFSFAFHFSHRDDFKDAVSADEMRRWGVDAAGCRAHEGAVELR